MTLQDFRKLLRGCNTHAELVFETDDGKRYKSCEVLEENHARVVIRIDTAETEKPKLTHREKVDHGPIPF